MILKEALFEGKQKLRTAGIPTPELDAELLLSHILQKDRSCLIVHHDMTLSGVIYNKYILYITRRIQGECVAYITKRKKFRNLNLYVNKKTLVPRPDTEILVETALSWIDTAVVQNKKRKTISVLDICTGSGAVALALLDERPYIKVFASDISRAALAVAKQNYLKLLKLKRNDFFEHKMTIIESDIFASITGKFSIIVANPPYIKSSGLETLPKEVRAEPKIALDGGKDGLTIIKKIITGAKYYLEDGGALFIEAGPQEMPDIKKIFEELKYNNITITKDLAGLNRVIGGESC
ncbi:MAG: peptide chain release factor N(5)-glutamine methyltransferase [Spirochaetaceae bacterium]|jgi:release factor glutamine methyltransferase|nr:peptide chain release factor N(5)-glutamine methyltransferase [Spirochaetaceae bacterium]